jgi:hypothetical protein
MREGMVRLTIDGRGGAGQGFHGLLKEASVGYTNMRMNSSIHGLREILRAFAEVRDGPFHQLWLELTKRVRSPKPKTGFRIFQVANGAEAMVAVWVSARGRKGHELSWGVSVQTVGDELWLLGSVSVGDGRGSRALFEVTDRTADGERAAELLRSFATQVCTKLEYLDGSGIVGTEKRTSS